MSFERYTFRGIVFEVGPRNTSARGYTWREVVLTDGAAVAPQFVPFTFARDRVDEPAAFAPGALVDVEFALRGFVGSTGRAFAQLRGLAIRAAQLAPAPGAAGSPQQPAPQPAAVTGTPPPDAGPPPGAPAEDLPF